MTELLTPQGVRLEYEQIGEGAAAPMLLIQGLGAQMIGWRREFCEMLAAESFRVIRFDTRDTGLSQKFPGQVYELSDLADDVIGLLDSLGIDAAHIVGRSLGGGIAQELVIKAPERVASLCLLYTAPSPRFLRMDRNWDELIGRPPPGSREEAIARFEEDERWAASDGYAFDATWARELGGLMWDRCWYPEGGARHFAAMRRSADHTEALRGVRAPTLIVHGDSDRLVELTAAMVLAEAIPDSELKIYPGLGHEVHPEIWSDLVPRIAGNARRGGVAVPGPAPEGNHDV
jgi:pimeloyl-ACP methyl ester carboxylesterase